MFQIITGYCNWIFLVSIALSLVSLLLLLLLLLILFVSFFRARDNTERWFFQRVHLCIRAVAEHKLSTLNTRAQSFNSWIISQCFYLFCKYQMIFFHPWLNKCTTHCQFMIIHELWNSIIFRNFKTSLVIAHPAVSDIMTHCLRKSISNSPLNE